MLSGAEGPELKDAAKLILTPSIDMAAALRDDPRCLKGFAACPEAARDQLAGLPHAAHSRARLSTYECDYRD